eukprot:5669090-Alexandrium_andersonii.AAC.1
MHVPSYALQRNPVLTGSELSQYFFPTPPTRSNPLHSMRCNQLGGGRPGARQRMATAPALGH